MTKPAPKASRYGEDIVNSRGSATAFLYLVRYQKYNYNILCPKINESNHLKGHNHHANQTIS